MYATKQTMSKHAIRVAMIAPPWLPIPPSGYGGVENVLNGLVPALMRLGVEVVLFTVGDSKIRASAKHWVYQTGQFSEIHKPSYDAMAVYVAHLLKALEVIREDGQFDIIHDHNTCVGPLVFAYAENCLPPAIHTIHNPPFTTDDYKRPGIPDNRPMWRQLAKTAKRLHLVGISRAMDDAAPKEVRHLMLPPVHNAVVVDDFPFVSKKSDYFITLARFHPEKGQHIAIRACQKLGFKLKMAGNVGDISTKQRLMLELANPLSPYRSLTDFRYYSDHIYPHTLDPSIEYMGEVSGQHKLEFISHAKALLFPIQWEEPFGMAPIEAMASGTPVVAMARGAMPEIIEHGVNGFLAKNEKEFTQYVERVGEIDPVACRQSVEKNFSAEIMAERYLAHYKTVIGQSKTR